MDDTPWTKGPYRVAGHVVYALEEYRDRRGKVEERNRITIQVEGGPDTPTEEVDAVKALIAAAPEMAEALVVALEALHDAKAFAEFGGIRPAYSHRIDTIRAALAKARGDQ